MRSHKLRALNLKKTAGSIVSAVHTNASGKGKGRVDAGRLVEALGNTGISVSHRGGTLSIDASDSDSTVSFWDVQKYRDEDIRTVRLGDNISDIGPSAFANWNMENVEFSNLRSVGRHAFEKCRNLQSVSCTNGSNPQLTVGAYAFRGTGCEDKEFESFRVKNEVPGSLN